MKLPEPPPDSCLVVDADEHECPRLTWAKPVRPAAYAFAFLAVAGFGGGLAYLVSLLVRPGAGLQGKAFLACLGGACFLGLMLALLVWGLARNLIYGPTPRRITFGPDALLFEPALRHHPNQSIYLQIKEVSRGELGAIRLRQRAWRPVLTIDCGVTRLEVGIGLDERELEWLAGVLRAWAGRPEGDASSVPRLPAGSWIRVEAVEGEPGAWRLSWEPPIHPLTHKLARWGVIVGLVNWLVGCATITIALKVFCVGALVRQLLGGWDWLAFALLALLVLFLYASTRAAGGAVGQIRQLAAKVRPESITLANEALTYDPGNFLRVSGTGRGGAILPGPRTIPRSEIHEDSLVPVEACIVLLHGEEEFIIGRCLRELEREWLVKVLRIWLRGGQPPVPEPDGSRSPDGQSIAPAGL